MRDKILTRVERYRLTTGALKTSKSDGRNGYFVIQTPFGSTLKVIVSDGTNWEECGLPLPAWEHVSVSVYTFKGHTVDRCPTWEEMDWIKDLFWRPDELVMQFHVPVKDNINYHEYCLHLWKPVGVDIPLPPTETVGPKQG